MGEKNYYRDAYEKEHLKCAEYAERIARLEEEKDYLQFRLDRIHNNPLWKSTSGLRKVMHAVKRQTDRVKNCGGPRGVAAKLKYKQREHIAMKQHGTASFPTDEVRKQQQETAFEKKIKFSILVPLYNTPEDFLREMIGSVIWQTYQNWELCLADGSDAEHGNVGMICKEFAAKDKRIKYSKLEKNEGISGNTNECLKMAAGDYICLFDHDDILHPCVLFEYVKAINEQDADYLYCDETTFKDGSIDKMITLHFKPDYAIDNLRANNYICHFSCFKKELLDGMELFRKQFDGSQDHDMILRLTDKAKKVVHVPKLLYYWRSHAGSVASDISAKSYAIEAARGAVADHLRSHGYRNFKITSTRAFETIFKISYEILGNPKVSIIIANKDHVEDLKRCITSIREKTTYDNYEIIVVENNSETEEIFEYYKELTDGKFDQNLEIKYSETYTKTPYFVSNDGRTKVVRFKGEFNYAAINNLGVEFADGEYVLLLNNDTQVITVNWLEELLMYAQRKDVGAVGGKLFYGNKTIQHAGVVIGLGAHRTAGHTHYGQSRENLGYMGRLCYTQNVTAVTGACLMVKKYLYLLVGGLDTNFAVSLNDVDFCLRLRKRGLLNVFTPFAELYHFESISRGLDDSGEKAQRYNKESERFREKWKKELAKGDPYYNPNFSLDRSDYSLKI